MRNTHYNRGPFPCDDPQDENKNVLAVVRDCLRSVEGCSVMRLVPSHFGYDDLSESRLHIEQVSCPHFDS
jgi:hypothetical protein